MISYIFYFLHPFYNGTLVKHIAPQVYNVLQVSHSKLKGCIKTLRNNISTEWNS